MSDGDNRPEFEIAVPSVDPEKKDADKPKSSSEGEKPKDSKDEPEIVGAVASHPISCDGDPTAS